MPRAGPIVPTHAVPTITTSVTAGSRVGRPDIAFHTPASRNPDPPRRHAPAELNDVEGSLGAPPRRFGSATVVTAIRDTRPEYRRERVDHPDDGTGGLVDDRGRTFTQPGSEHLDLLLA